MSTRGYVKKLRETAKKIDLEELESQRRKKEKEKKVEVAKPATPGLPDQLK